MTTSCAYRKGWCPTLERPMESGDGWLARVPIPHGTLNTDAACAIAMAAKKYGNGIINLTARGNLQIRGVTSASHPSLVQAISELGFTEPGYNGHILTSPLAGIDPACDATILTLADKLASALSSTTLGTLLPPKFLIVFDGGGRLPMQDMAADIRCDATLTKDIYALTLANHVAPTGYVHASDIVPSLLAITRSFTGLLQSQPAIRRMRDISDNALWKDLLKPFSINTDALTHDAKAIASLSQWERGRVRANMIGFFPLSDAYGVAAIGIAFSSMDHAAFFTLAQLAQTYGDGTLRLTPWRSIFLPAITSANANKICHLASEAGFITEDTDTRHTMAVCPGAPACSSAHGSTYALAHSIAQAFPGMANSGYAVHISGCAKGCARPAAADIVVVASDNGGYHLAFDASACAAPAYTTLTPKAVMEKMAHHIERHV